jgi:solute:Na+ symporter, SSS family
VSPALAVIGGVFVFAIALGLLARRGRVMNLEQWTVGGRGFGTPLVFLLMAGEIYTTFALLGGSGWAYGRGVSVLYILCFNPLAYAGSYFLLPRVWRFATERRLVSQPDFFVAKYGSVPLGILVALVGVAAILPYLVLQMRGLGIIVSEASYGAVSPAVAVWIGTAALVGYVVTSGVRGSAWTAVVKDFMIIIVVVGLGTYLPLHYYGSYHGMFAAIDRVHPEILTLPPVGKSRSWFLSTVALSAMGFYMWPHFFGSSYTARDANVFRKNAGVMPLYGLVQLFAFFVGFAAILQVPGLSGTAADLSLFRISKQTFGPWIVGVIGAAGLLTALVPGSMLLMTSSTIIAQNIYRPLARRATDRSVVRLARSLVPVIATLAVLVTLRQDQMIVGLLLTGYNFVTQLFPALLASLSRTPIATPAGAFWGILVGEAIVAWFTLSGSTLATLLPRAPAAVRDLNEGLVALAVNVLVLIAVSRVTAKRRSARGESSSSVPRRRVPSAG